MISFKIFSETLDGRIDTYFYHPKFQELAETMNSLKCGVKPLNSFIKRIDNGVDVREYSSFGIRYLKVANIKSLGVDIENSKFVNNTNISRLLKLHKDNILLTRKGTFGVAYSLDNDLDALISSEVFRLDIKNINSKYLQYFLNSDLGQKQFDKASIGTIMGSLSQDAVKSILIPDIDSAHQVQIISIMDSALKKKKEMEANAENLLNSVKVFLLSELNIVSPSVKDKKFFKINANFIANSRIDTHYNNPSFECLGEALGKTKYNYKTLDDEIDFIPGYAFSSDDYVENGVKLLTIGNIKNNSIDMTKSVCLPIEYSDKYSRFLIKKKDIVFAMTGATIGKTSVFERDDKVLLNQRVGIIRCKNNMNPHYLSNLLNIDIIKKLILRGSVGGAQPNISESNIRLIKLPIPDIDTQNKIANEIQNRITVANKMRTKAIEIYKNALKEVEKILLS